MLKLKTILVPVDLSPRSVPVAEHAVHMAERFGSDLILAHVIEPFPYAAVNAMAFINYEERLIPETQALLDDLTNDAPKLRRPGRAPSPCDFAAGAR